MKLALPALALLVPSLAAQTTWSVDDDQPANFDDLQTAYDTVAPGDVLRVGSGSYGSLTMSGKGLTIVADAPDCVVDGKITVSQTAQPVLIRGLRVAPDAQDDAREFLFVDSPAAPVWIEDVRPSDDATSQGHVTVFHDGSVAWAPERTTLIRCSNRSAVTAPTEGPSGSAFVRSGLLVAGQVSVLDCDLWGWRGEDGSIELSGPVDGTDGGAGIYQSFPPTPDSLYLSGTRAHGGDGGAGATDGVVCASGGAGGAGLENFGEFQGAGVFAKDCTFTGGSGAAEVGTCAATADGARWTGPLTPDGGVTLLAGLYREFLVEPAAVSGEYTFTFRSRQAGSFCFWTPAAIPNPLFVPALAGVIVPNTFVPLTLAGTADADGEYSFTLSAGPQAWSGQTLYLQSVYITFGRATGDSRPVLGGPTAVVLIP